MNSNFTLHVQVHRPPQIIFFLSILSQVHVYELTQHDDKYDLRYRLKDKIYLPSSTTPSTSSWSSSAFASSAPGSSFNRADDSKEAYRDSGSSEESHHSRGDRRSASSDSAEDGDGGVVENGGRGSTTTAFLLVTWSNVIVCEGRVLQLYDFSGTKVFCCCCTYSTVLTRLCLYGMNV